MLPLRTREDDFSSFGISLGVFGAELMAVSVEEVRRDRDTDLEWTLLEAWEDLWDSGRIWPIMFM